MKKTLSMLAIMSAVLVSCTKSEISQDGGNPESTFLNVYYDDIVFPSKGGEEYFDIESNTDWTISNNSDWLTIEPTEGNGYASVTLTASASDVYGEGTVSVRPSPGEFPVDEYLRMAHGPVEFEPVPFAVPDRQGP